MIFIIFGVDLLIIDFEKSLFIFIRQEVWVSIFVVPMFNLIFPFVVFLMAFLYTIFSSILFMVLFYDIFHVGLLTMFHAHSYSNTQCINCKLPFVYVIGLQYLILIEPSTSPGYYESLL